MKTPPDDIAERLVAISDELQGTGFDVTVDDVAKLADVPRATLYYYFSGKDDLVAFFLNHKIGLVETALADAARGEGGVGERVELALRAVLHAFAEHPVLCTDLPVAIHRAGNFQEVAARVDQVVLAPLRELLIEGKATGELRLREPSIVATAMVGALMQASFMQVAHSGAVDADGLAEELVPILLRGLGIEVPVSAA